jgi:hypothetical protein
MKSKPIEVKAKGLTVKIFVSHTTKKEKVYVTYQVADYSSGKRKLWSFADESDARAKALELCEAIGKGQQFGDADLARLYLEKRSIHNAMEEAQALNMRVDEAVRLVRQATEIIRREDILQACRFWKDHRPDKPITPKRAGDAVTEYLARNKGRVSIRRHRVSACYLASFSHEFGSRLLDEIQAIQISDWANGKSWSRKTRNDVLGVISLLYRDAVQRGYAARNPADSKSIAREKLRGGSVSVFTPDEGRAIMARISDDLKPFMSLWLFGLMRKEEVARLTWAQIGQGLASGSIYMSDDQTKNRQARSIPITDNLRAWLMRYRKSTGLLLPESWQGKDEAHRIQRLDDLVKHIRRKSKVAWKSNAPRHSSISYSLTLSKDPVETAKRAGTSLLKIQRHYWSRSEAVTAESASEWFGIFPELSNVVPIVDQRNAAA